MLFKEITGKNFSLTNILTNTVIVFGLSFRGGGVSEIMKLDMLHTDGPFQLLLDIRLPLYLRILPGCCSPPFLVLD